MIITWNVSVDLHFAQLQMSTVGGSHNDKQEASSRVGCVTLHVDCRGIRHWSLVVVTQRVVGATEEGRSLGSWRHVGQTDLEVGEMASWKRYAFYFIAECNVLFSSSLLTNCCCGFCFLLVLTTKITAETMAGT